MRLLQDVGPLVCVGPAPLGFLGPTPRKIHAREAAKQLSETVRFVTGRGIVSLGSGFTLYGFFERQLTEANA